MDTKFFKIYPVFICPHDQKHKTEKDCSICCHNRGTKSDFDGSYLHERFKQCSYGMDYFFRNIYDKRPKSCDHKGFCEGCPKYTTDDCLAAIKFSRKNRGRS